MRKPHAKSPHPQDLLYLWCDKKNSIQVRRKASPRELAEAFKGHGLRQATWAPVPIFWARSVEELPMSRGQLPALPAAAAEQVQLICQLPRSLAHLQIVGKPADHNQGLSLMGVSFLNCADFIPGRKHQG